MVKIVDKQNIFNSGILSTKLYSRDDLKQYNNGVSAGMNFICSRYGPMEKRVGTQFVWDLANPDAKVFFLPFVFSVKQSLLLEFLAHKIRFYTFDGLDFKPIADNGAWYSPNGLIFSEQSFPASSTGELVPKVGDTIYADSNRTQVFGTVSSLTYGPAVTDPTKYEVKTITVDGVNYVKAIVEYQINTPFDEDQLDDIAYVQSLDVVYLAFADRKTPPYMLTRKANNNWSIELFQTEDGPYLDKNYATNKTMTITDKNTGTSNINLANFTLGQADIGRWIRVCTPRYNENTYAYEDKWSYGKIAAVNGTGTSITVNWTYRSIVDESDQSWMTKPTSEWRLGVWHTGTGNKDYPVTYPTKVSIHQQRLVWAGMTDRPWIWTSNSFAYKNYAPSDYEGEIVDTNSISYDISTDKVSEIFWIKSVKSLLIGTELGELRMFSAGTAITPADVVTNRESSYGCHNAEPIVTDDMIIFVQRLQRTLRSLSYDHNLDAFVGPELTVLAEHLTAGGIKKIVFQKEPNNIIWCLKEDGELLTLTYDKAQDVVGWSQCKLAGTDAKVMDLAVLPSNTHQQDMVLFAVERTINGQRKRYLEFLSRNFTEEVTQAEACFLDCAVHYQTDDETGHNYITGLDFLEGETVHVTDEGARTFDYVVEDGTIILDYPIKDAWIGLPYPAYFETLERDFGDRQISTKMSKLRIYKMRLYLDRTLGLSLSRLDRGSETKLLTFNPAYPTDTPPELMTGKVDIDVASTWDCDYRLKVVSEPGLPCTVSGIIIGVEINEL